MVEELEKVKCFCGKKLSEKDIKDIHERLDEIGNSLEDGGRKTTSFRVDCDCGFNKVVFAEVIKDTSGVVRTNITSII